MQTRIVVGVNPWENVPRNVKSVQSVTHLPWINVPQRALVVGCAMKLESVWKRQATVLFAEALVKALVLILKAFFLSVNSATVRNNASTKEESANPVHLLKILVNVMAFLAAVFARAIKFVEAKRTVLMNAIALD